MPARAAYAAAEAEVLPVEAQMIAPTSSASAFVTATVMPRSLNDPVGFWPSHLRYSSTPGATTAASPSARTSGVFPSFRVTIFSVGSTGSRSRYCAISPPQARATLMGAGYYYQRFAGLQHIRLRILIGRCPPPGEDVPVTWVTPAGRVDMVDNQVEALLTSPAGGAGRARHAGLS